MRSLLCPVKDLFKVVSKVGNHPVICPWGAGHSVVLGGRAAPGRLTSPPSMSLQLVWLPQALRPKPAEQEQECRSLGPSSPPFCHQHPTGLSCSWHACCPGLLLPCSFLLQMLVALVPPGSWAKGHMCCVWEGGKPRALSECFLKGQSSARGVAMGCLQATGWSVGCCYPGTTTGEVRGGEDLGTAYYSSQSSWWKSNLLPLNLPSEDSKGFRKKKLVS